MSNQQRAARRTRNLETCSIAIFSEDLGSLDEFHGQLQKLINYITVFDTENDVRSYIQENKYDLIILIVSIELAETILKCTHDLKQLYQIYIYNPMNTSSQWTNDYKKIQAVTISSDTLLEVLGTKFNPMSTNEESFLKFDRFTVVIWYLPFIQLLINLNQENNDRQALIDYLKVLYDEKNTPSELKCYRGQQMYRSEIEALEIDQRICSTSFLSITRNYKLALEVFAGVSTPRSPTDALQPVLFNIHPFHLNYNRSIVADVTNLSQFGGEEQEVLFAVGTCFRVARIGFDDHDKVWSIDLEEDYVQDQIGKSKRSVHIDIITIGFYLLVQDDDFQSVQTFYHVLLEEANSPLWIVSCHVGLGLIKYYKKNYLSALKTFEDVIKIIDEENLWKTCQIIGNIYCILANVHREMKNYDKAWEFYQRTVKTRQREYFIEKDRCFWEMYIYKTKLNPFVKDDKYFYYCDRPSLNMVLLYKRIRKWDLARDTFQKVLQDYFEHQRNGDVEMFVKILSDNEENSDAHALIEKNRAFLSI